MRLTTILWRFTSNSALPKCLCLHLNKTATKVIWSLGVYVATSFREIKLLHVMECNVLVCRKQRYKTDKENYLYFVSAALWEHSLDSAPSVVINNVTTLFFYETHLLLISSTSGFREKNVELPIRLWHYKSPLETRLYSSIDWSWYITEIYCHFCFQLKIQSVR